MNNLSEYLRVRDQMKTGDSIFWMSYSLLGLLIRWKTKACVNHVAKVCIMTDCAGNERVEIIEAMENGMQTRHLSERLQQFKGSVYWCPLKPSLESIRKHFSTAISEFQDNMEVCWIKYDYKAILKQIFGRVEEDSSRLFCSEADWMLTERAVELSRSKPAKDLIKRLKDKWGGKAPSPGDMYYSELYQKSHRIM